MGLVFCFIGGCTGFSCVLIPVSIFVSFVLNNFWKLVNFLSYSDWSVVVVVLSIFRLVHSSSRSQSTPSSGCMFSYLVISNFQFFLFPLLSAFPVIFPASFISLLLTSWYLLVIGEIFLLFIVCLSCCIAVTGDPSSYDDFFSYSVDLYCHRNDFFGRWGVLL